MYIALPYTFFSLTRILFSSLCWGVLSGLTFSHMPPKTDGECVVGKLNLHVDVLGDCLRNSLNLHAYVLINVKIRRF